MPAAPSGRGTWWVLVPIRLMCDQRWDRSVSLSPHSTSALAQPRPYEPGRPRKRPQGAQEPAGRRELENVPRVWRQQQQAGRAAGSRAQLPGHAQQQGSGYAILCPRMPSWDIQTMQSCASPSWVHARLGHAAPSVPCQGKPCPAGSCLANLAHAVPKAALCQAMPWNTELSSAQPRHTTAGPGCAKLSSAPSSEWPCQA